MGAKSADLLALAEGTFMGAHPGTTKPEATPPTTGPVTNTAGPAYGGTTHQRNKVEATGHTVNVNVPGATSGSKVLLWLALGIGLLALLFFVFAH